MHPYRTVPEEASVLRIRPDGEHEVAFSLRNVPGFETGRVLQFAVTHRGEVSFVASRARSPREFEIAQLGFDKDARHVSRVRLGENFVVSQVAPFPT